ncbi:MULTISPECIES: YihY/virulence factor BrkB family protein [Bradyrhizobium]|uniref:YihY/virulence factor BrkB family protein n=1 Tax=Bradyrhizobium elkanii TaxID=29448 RepID=UPI0003F7976A|nr:YihY/virulence factor BrkB family protein [Bradyrhizobium elkanii]
MSSIRFPDRPRNKAGQAREARDRLGGPSAEQDHRGRGATSPWQIPWAGWKDILLRTYEQINKDRVLAVAAGVVFYGLLALFPAITAIVSSYALFSSPTTINDHLAALAGLLPQGALDIVRDQVDRVVAKGDTKLGFAFAFSFLLAVWSANGGMKAVIDALNVVYEEDEKRGFFKLNAVSLAFTFGGIIAALVAISGVVALPIILGTFGASSVVDNLLRIGRWPVLVLAMLFGLAILYRYGPSRRSPQWRWLTVGSVFATLSWLAGSAAFSFYLANYANYGATYGSLGAAIGLMMWMWMSAIVILVSAELNAEVEHQTARDSTDGSGKPLGARGARMADTVGEQKTS